MRHFIAGLLMLIACSLALAEPPSQVTVVREISLKRCNGVRCEFERYEWRAWSADPERHYLYQVTPAPAVQLGGWCYRECVWRGYDPQTNTWGLPLDSPPQPFTPPGIPCLPGRANDADSIEPPMYADLPPDGVDVEALREFGRRDVDAGGRPLSRAQALARLEANAIPDDADALRVTFIGSPADGDRVRKSLPTRWTDKLTYQSYPSPDVPMLRDLGFASGIHMQAPTGMPLNWCAADASAEQIAAAIELAEARRKDPKWDPLKWAELAKAAPAAPPADPQPVPPPANPAPSPIQVPESFWAGVIAIVTFLAGALTRFLALRAKADAPPADKPQA